MNTKYNLPSVSYYKYTDSYEISLSLFDKCNLNCDFCFQNKHNKIDINDINDLPKKLIPFILKEIERTYSKIIIFRLWGGEIFSDDIDNDVFLVYENLYKNIIESLNTHLPNIKIKFVCTSNGIFENHDRVNNFLKKINSTLALSYDPIGRFKTRKHINMFLNTYRYFKDDLECMAITLTKPTIYKLIEGDQIFNSFPSTLCIDMNYYVANQGWEKELPNDDDLFNFYKWAIDNNKFNIVSKLLKGFILDDENMVENSCMCKNFTLYINGEYMNDCVKIMSIYPGTDFYGKYHDNITWENSCEIRATLGFIKRGCFSCNYQHLCSGMCWCSLIFKGYDIGECPIQRLYDYIKNDDQLFHEIKSSILNEVNGI
jgi:sulfatase maturation enzyme AslB (radical SAM superfamily)